MQFKTRNVVAATLPSWFDFEDGEIYGAFTVIGSPPSQTISNVQGLEPGVWQYSVGSNTPTYLHNDHLGTLRETSNGDSAGSHRVQRLRRTFRRYVSSLGSTRRIIPNRTPIGTEKYRDCGGR